MGCPPRSHGLLASAAACTGAPAHANPGFARGCWQHRHLHRRACTCIPRVYVGLLARASGHAGCWPALQLEGVCVYGV